MLSNISGSPTLDNGEIFYTMKKAVALFGRWRQQYDTIRLHNSLGYKAPALEPVLHRPASPPYATLRSKWQGDHTTTVTWAPNLIQPYRHTFVSLRGRFLRRR